MDMFLAILVLSVTFPYQPWGTTGKHLLIKTKDKDKDKDKGKDKAGDDDGGRQDEYGENYCGDCDEPCKDHNGIHRNNGDVWTCADGCNLCSCHTGRIDSTDKRSCQTRKTCIDETGHHHHGQSWKCGEMWCSCDNGHINKTPPEPEPGHLSTPASTCKDCPSVLSIPCKNKIEGSVCQVCQEEWCEGQCRGGVCKVPQKYPNPSMTCESDKECHNKHKGFRCSPNRWECIQSFGDCGAHEYCGPGMSCIKTMDEVLGSSMVCVLTEE